MEKNEIKKLLYKQNPPASFVNVRKDGLLYEAFLLEEELIDVWKETKETRGVEPVSFFIPLGEIGEVIWKRTMDAKLLIRWIQD